MTASGAPAIDKFGEPAALPCPRHRGFLRLRISEKLIVAFLAYLALAAWLFPLDGFDRWVILGINGLACVVLEALGRFERPLANGSAQNQEQFPERFFSLAPPHGSRLLGELRNWLPLPLVLVVYRESGLFVRSDRFHRLDELFVGWDHHILGNLWVLRAVAADGPWLAGYLEIVYLLCYPLVPLGLAAVLIHSRRPKGSFVRTRECERCEELSATAVDEFWTTVLLAAFCAYGLFPFFPLTPPRVLYHDLPLASPSWLRGANLWLLDHYGVQACIFPSGHVAVVTATALAVRRRQPRLGLVFLWVALSIAVATVLLRYHYSADTLAGAAVAAAAFLGSRRLHAYDTN